MLRPTMDHSGNFLEGVLITAARIAARKGFIAARKKGGADSFWLYLDVFIFSQG